MKQLMAGGGVALVGITLIPLLSGLFGQEPQAGFPACTYAIALSLLWITALYHKERIAVRISTHQ